MEKQGSGKEGFFKAPKIQIVFAPRQAHLTAS